MRKGGNARRLAGKERNLGEQRVLQAILSVLSQPKKLIFFRKLDLQLSLCLLHVLSKHPCEL